jgi:hypothetical protein
MWAISVAIHIEACSLYLLVSNLVVGSMSGKFTVSCVFAGVSIRGYGPSAHSLLIVLVAMLGGIFDARFSRIEHE